MAGAGSPRRGRLSRSADFDRVMRNGRSQAGREFVLYVFPRGGQEPARLGLSVSRKVGGAVERNRVKRLLREAFTQESPRFPTGADAVVIARPGARELAEREGLGGVQRALRALIDKLDVHREDEGSVLAGSDGPKSVRAPDAGAGGSEEEA